jgi:hypothetical protein
MDVKYNVKIVLKYLTLKIEQKRFKVI